MIKLKNFQALLWRNPFADHPTAVVDIESETAVSWRISHLTPGAIALIGDRFPTLCVGSGDLAASQLLAAICLKLQREKYDLPAAAGATDSQFWFAAIDPVYASITAGLAVAFLNGIISRPQITDPEVAASLVDFIGRCEATALDQSSRAMVAMASARGIPWFRLHPAIPDIQFGHGQYQHRMRETLHSDESLLSVTYSQNKALTLALLSGVGLPVGNVAVIGDPDQAAAKASAVGFPVVLKPIDGAKGVGVIVGLADPEAVRVAAGALLQSARQLIVQSFLPGDDHRLLVVSGRLIAAARREPPAVVGDGVQSIAQLIEGANLDPRRGTGFQKLMNLIEVDDELLRVLSAQGLTVANVPAAGVKVRLRLTANVSTGGSAVDVTDTIHPDNAWLAERAASVIGLTVAGVDFITPDITRSWREVGGGVCEVNAGVGLRPHWLADPSRDVVGPIMNAVFPSGADGRIPTALITGTNGKTTTTRMLDHVLRAGGHVVGSATTDGVTVNGRIVVEGDVAGPSGASIVLRDPSVTAACLETARGGVIQWGIGVDRCNVAALLNVDHEQVGIDGIETLDDMARLKRKVVETARDAFVFNAEDPRCHSISRDFPVERTILFSLDPSTEALRAHVAAGGTAVTLMGAGSQETIVIRGRGAEAKVLGAAEIPATFGGKVRHNLANALAAVAMAHGMGVPASTIAAGLAGFEPSLEHSQGRFNFIDDLPARVLFDFAANPPAIRAVLGALEQFAVAGRRICMVSTVGNRPDGHIADCALAVAHRFDRYVCFEEVGYRRGRAPGEIAERLAVALASAGVPKELISACATEEEALAAGANLVEPSDLLVVLGTDVRTALPELRAAFSRRQAPAIQS
ncbi:MAG: Mur ligase family protein [Caulobacterales bacterium]